MSTAIRDRLVTNALFALVCLTGCEREATEYGVAGGGTSWTSSATNAVPGIDQGVVTFVTLKAGPPSGVPFVVWSDLTGVSGGGGGTVHGAHYEGDHRGDGRHVDFQAKTNDGKVGTITIAGVEYDFAKGALFLVSARHDAPTVAQISFDLSAFPADDADAIKELAKTHPQIRDFFEKHKEGDTNGK